MDPEPAKTSSESYGKTKEDLVSRDMVKALTQDTFLPPPGVDYAQQLRIS